MLITLMIEWASQALDTCLIQQKLYCTDNNWVGTFLNILHVPSQKYKVHYLTFTLGI